MNPRQQRFVAEYLVDLNATQAAIRAGYSPRVANKYGPRMLRWPHIAEAVRKAMAEREMGPAITVERVLKEYARIAFADISRLAEWGPEGMTLKPRAELSPDDTAAIVELTPGIGKAGGGPKLRLHDKRAALEVIARHLRLFAARVAPAEEISDEEDREARVALLRRLRAMSDDPPAQGG